MPVQLAKFLNNLTKNRLEMLIELVVK